LLIGWPQPRHFDRPLLAGSMVCGITISTLESQESASRLAAMPVP